jgi:beta-N-acetylhexosaminidase
MVPPRRAAALVVGAAVLTAALLTAVDGIFGDDDPARDADRSGQPQVIDLSTGAYPGSAPAQEPEGQPRNPPAQVPLRRLVGAKVMVRMSGTAPSPELLRRVRRGSVGGVILFPDNVGSRSQLRRLTSRLRTAAREGGGAGFLIATDQEGGVVKRLQGGPPSRSAPQMGATGRRSVAEREGTATGEYLASLGINVNLAPVADVPASPSSFIANRAFGRDPRKVGEFATAFASGLASAGVAATAKHFPGLGRAPANTDLARSVVRASRAQLRSDIEPFRQTVQAGIGLVMMSNAIYTAYDSRRPAVLSPAMVAGQLRDGLGFDGVVITDDLDAASVRSVASPARAAVQAARAGVDVVLYAKTPAAGQAAFGALLAAARGGSLNRVALEDSYNRIEALQRELAGG